MTTSEIINMDGEQLKKFEAIVLREFPKWRKVIRHECFVTAWCVPNEPFNCNNNFAARRLNEKGIDWELEIKGSAKC